MKTSINFIFKQKIVLSKIVFITCVLNTFINSLIMIVLPILITEKLKLSSQMYGIATGILVFGGLFAGIFTGILKYKIEKLQKLFLMLTFSFIPLFIAPFFAKIKILSFILILISSFLIMFIAIVIYILIITYIQNNTLENITGKIMAFILTLYICSQPLGQLFYGLAFEYGVEQESFIILIAIIISIFTYIYANKSFKKLKIF